MRAGSTLQRRRETKRCRGAAYRHLCDSTGPGWRLPRHRLDPRRLRGQRHLTDPFCRSADVPGGGASGPLPLPKPCWDTLLDCNASDDRRLVVNADPVLAADAPYAACRVPRRFVKVVGFITNGHLARTAYLLDQTLELPPRGCADHRGTRADGAPAALSAYVICLLPSRPLRRTSLTVEARSSRDTLMRPVPRPRPCTRHVGPPPSRDASSGSRQTPPPRAAGT